MAQESPSTDWFNQVWRLKVDVGLSITLTVQFSRSVDFSLFTGLSVNGYVYKEIHSGLFIY